MWNGRLHKKQLALCFRVSISFLAFVICGILVLIGCIQSYMYIYQLLLVGAKMGSLWQKKHYCKFNLVLGLESLFFDTSKAHLWYLLQLLLHCCAFQ